MKINKFQRLRDCRIFRDFTWPARLESFERYNLIYGWNGSGKTTLSALLLGLERGHNTVGGECVLQADGRPLDISHLSAKVPSIRVFNRDTVSRAIFEVPGSAQLPPVFVIGEKNVEKGKQIEELKVKLSERRADAVTARAALTEAENALEVFCTDRARDIKILLTIAGGGPYNNYDKGGFKAAVQRFRQLDPAPKPLSEDERAKLLAKKDDKPKPKITALSQDYPGIPKLTTCVREALQKSITSSVIQELADNAELARWVSEGLELHRGPGAGISCKFCGQVLPKTRIKDLEAHFNDEFNKFQDEIADLLERISSMYDDIKALNSPEKERLYRHLAAEYEKSRSTFVVQRNATLTYLGLLRKAVEAKKEQPFQAIDLNTYIAPEAIIDKGDGILIALLKAIMAGMVVWGAYTGADALKKLAQFIQSHNEHSDNFEDEIRKARQALEQDDVANAMPEYARLTDEIATKKDMTVAADLEVERTVNEIMTLEAQMRGYLEPAARLTDDLASYLGRRELIFEAQDTGYTITRDGVPATHLSEGEQTAIAFLYFLRTLEETSFDLKNATIVVDDPASSLDETSIYSAFGHMKARVQNAAQIFVLTHNFRLFSLVRNWFNHVGKRGQSNRHYMLRAKYIGDRRGAVITKLDPLLSEHESDYHFMFKWVREEAAEGAEERPLESCYPMPNVGRRLLDGFLAYRCPGAGTLHSKMSAIPFDEARRAKLFRFVDMHSHENETALTGHDPSILLETRPILRDLLAFIEVGDKGHYDQMIAATNQPEE